MKNMEEERFFNYEKKKAKYDPKTGKIELLTVKMKEDPKIIKNFDDMQAERKRLHDELKLNTKDIKNSSVDELSKRYQELYERTEEGYLINKSEFYAETADNMRVDCGLIVQRHPIFLHYTKRDHDFAVFKNTMNNEYNLDYRKYYKDFKHEASLVDELLAKNSYVTISNRDNLPTHRLVEEDGTVKRYAAASKNWRLVDPNVTDNKSLHYCAAQRTYLLFRNRYTGEWEFPSTKMYTNDSFIEVRREFFTELSKNFWFVTHPGN